MLSEDDETVATISKALYPGYEIFESASHQGGRLSGTSYISRILFNSFIRALLERKDPSSALLLVSTIK